MVKAGCRKGHLSSCIGSGCTADWKVGTRRCHSSVRDRRSRRDAAGVPNVGVQLFMILGIVISIQLSSPIPYLPLIYWFELKFRRRLVACD